MPTNHTDTKKPGRYSGFFGQYIPETLLYEVTLLAKSYTPSKNDPEFQNELKTLLRDYANRPSMLYYSTNMPDDLG
mgnify:CR=1 FL=1